jgi:hemerythrin-like domain-containing protein
MAKRSNTRSRAPDAIKLLKNDHDEVSALFQKYNKGHKRLSESQKESLAQEICQMLTVHTQIEEEIFYPACQEHVKGADELLAEAKVEHQSAKDLIAKIEEGSPDSEDYDAEVMVLGEYVKHHIKEEQNELFPKVRKSKLDLKELGQRLAERKSSLMAAEEAEESSMAAE